MNDVAAVASEEERTVTVTDAAKLVSVSRRTIYNWLRLGRLRTRRTASGSTRIYPSSLWKQERER